MHASLDPVVEQPVGCSLSTTCHRWAMMAQHRFSSSAVCGYSSLSIMFLDAHSAISCLGRGLHPGRDECREVEPGHPVQQKLVVHDLVGAL